MYNALKDWENNASSNIMNISQWNDINAYKLNTNWWNN